MEKSSQKSNKHSQIERLQQRHAALKAQIAGLDQRRFLTEDEQAHVHTLKKARLAAKDELNGLRRRSGE